MQFLLGQFSLVLGITACLMIFTFVHFHQTFDKIYFESEKIYRLNFQFPDQLIALSSGDIKEKINSNFQEIEVTHFMKTPVLISFEYEDYVFSEENGLTIDKDFFTIFDQKILVGNQEDLLEKTNTILLSKELATNLFGDYRKAMNKVLATQIGPHKINLTVRGILNDHPDNSSMNYNYLLFGIKSFYWNDQNPRNVFHTFLKIDNQSQSENLVSFLDRLDEYENDFALQKLEDIHLSKGINFDFIAKFDSQYLIILNVIGLLILLITIFNFFNLFNIQVQTRLKEFITKKVLGASKLDLGKILFVEIQLFLLIAFFISFSSIYFFKETIRERIGFDPVVFYDWELIFLLGFGISIFVILIISVIVNQLYKHETNLGLKGILNLNRREPSLGKLFLTTQLIMTLFAITASYMVREQTNLLKNTEIGYDYHDLVVINRPETLELQTWINLENELLKQSSVKSIGKAVFPSIGEYLTIGLKDLFTQETHTFSWMGVNEKYIPTMNLELINGRNFDQELNSDIDAIIVNESALEALGGPSVMDRQFQFRRKNRKIIGVIKDYYHQSLKKKSKPLVLSLNSSRSLRYMLIKYKTKTQRELNDIIEKTKEKLQIRADLKTVFLENVFNDKLLKEENILTLVTLMFSYLAIFISALGLINSFTFTLKRKKKELSIRKILGARLRDNLGFLLKRQIFILIGSIVIAIPSALVLVEKWTNQFLFKLPINFSLVLIPVSIVLILVLMLIVLFSVMIDRINPVINLRDE